MQSQRRLRVGSSTNGIAGVQSKACTRHEPVVKARVDRQTAV